MRLCPAPRAPRAGGSAGNKSWDNPGTNEEGGGAPQLTLAADLASEWVLAAGDLLEQETDNATLGRIVQISADEMPLLSYVGLSARCGEGWGREGWGARTVLEPARRDAPCTAARCPRCACCTLLQAARDPALLLPGALDHQLRQHGADHGW